jgi:hypothetical protein
VQRLHAVEQRNIRVLAVDPARVHFRQMREPTRAEHALLAEQLPQRVEQLFVAQRCHVATQLLDVLSRMHAPSPCVDLHVARGFSSLLVAACNAKRVMETSREVARVCALLRGAERAQPRCSESVGLIARDTFRIPSRTFSIFSSSSAQARALFNQHHWFRNEWSNLIRVHSARARRSQSAPAPIRLVTASEAALPIDLYRGSQPNRSSTM